MLPFIAYAAQSAIPNEFLSRYCRGEIQPCLQGIYNLALGLAIALAFLMIVIGAFQYMIGAAVNTKEAGRQKITDAIAGLAIIFLSGVALYWINPDIFNAQLIVYKVKKGGLTPPIVELGVTAGGAFSGFYDNSGKILPGVSGGAGRVCTDSNSRNQLNNCNSVLGGALDKVISSFPDTNIDGITNSQDKKALMLAVALNEQSCRNKSESINGTGTYGGIYSTKISAVGSRGSLSLPCASTQNKGYCLSRCKKINDLCARRLGITGLNCSSATVQDVANALSNTAISSCMAVSDLAGYANRYGARTLPQFLRIYVGGETDYINNVIGCFEKFRQLAFMPLLFRFLTFSNLK